MSILFHHCLLVFIINIFFLNAIRNTKKTMYIRAHLHTHIILLLHLRCSKRVELNKIRKKDITNLFSKILLCLYIKKAYLYISENNHLLENWCINFINCWSISTKCYLKASFCCKKAIISKDGISISTQTDKSKVNIGTEWKILYVWVALTSKISHIFSSFFLILLT